MLILEIPSRKEVDITIDLGTKLPEFGEFTVIAFFIGKLTKITHLVACIKQVTASKYTQIFVDNIVLATLCNGNLRGPS